MHNHLIDKIATEPSGKNSKEFDSYHFNFRGNNYKLFDIWGLSCEHLINNDDYKQMCLDNGWMSPSGKFFKTSAETTDRYFKDQADFIESHTALDDVEIESELFTEIIKASRNQYEMGIIYFPFRILGKVQDFEIKLALAR